MFDCWIEGRYEAILGCGERRLRIKVFGVAFTLWRWNV